MAHEMIFYTDMDLGRTFDDEHENVEEAEDEETESTDIDDELLGELSDDTTGDDLLDGESDPLTSAGDSRFDEISADEDDIEKDTGVFEDDEDVEDVDYDSFDDRDEM